MISTQLAGCLYTPPVWKEETSCEIWACPHAACDVTILLDVDDIIACYGTSGGSLPPVLADCDEEVQATPPEDCFLTHPDPFTAVATPTEVAANTLEDATAACQPEYEELWELDLDGEGQLEDWADQISVSCPIDRVGDPDLQGCATVEDPVQGEECPEGTQLSPLPAALYVLVIDPLLSFVDVDFGSSTVWSSLDGSASIASAPQRILRVLAWGDDFQYQSDDFTHNHVALSAPIQISGTGGSFVVPWNQDFELAFQGYRDAAEYAVAVEPSTTSGGTLDVPSAAWSYDFTDEGGGATVTIHLEGAIEDPSP